MLDNFSGAALSTVGFAIDRRLGLPRYAEVDSELLFRLADRFAPDGTIDGRGFRKALRLCRGQMSAVLASRLDPGAITVIKGNKPLSLRYSRKHRAVLYASEPEYIEAALDDPPGRRLGSGPWRVDDLRQSRLRSAAHRSAGGIRPEWPLCLYAGSGGGGDQRLDPARLAVQLQARP